MAKALPARRQCRNTHLHGIVQPVCFQALAKRLTACRPCMGSSVSKLLPSLAPQSPMALVLPACRLHVGCSVLPLLPSKHAQPASEPPWLRALPALKLRRHLGKGSAVKPLAGARGCMTEAFLGLQPPHAPPDKKAVCSRCGTYAACILHICNSLMHKAAWIMCKGTTFRVKEHTR